MIFLRRYFLALTFVLLIPLWGYFGVPAFYAFVSDFSYSVDVLSLDNFYDEASASFAGPQRSVTTFSYEVESVYEGLAEVRNTFDVRTVVGDPIFSVERLYGVDTFSGKHVPGHGDKERVGYLFAPRFKGLLAQVPDKSSFLYWHVNYDGATEMRYVGEEIIEGLLVYKYESHYEDADIDQTDNLTFLPGVGVSRGVNLDPYVALWVEPYTGRFVKYEDETIAYFYDLATGQRLHPWNRFSNTYNTSSITDSVAQARVARFELLLLTYGVLGILLLLVYVFFMRVRYRDILQVRTQKGVTDLYVSVDSAGKATIRKWKWAMYFVPAILIALLFSYIGYVSFGRSGDTTERVSIGISRWVPVGNDAYDQNIQGFKDALMQAGYVEGDSIVYIEETASGDRDQQEVVARRFNEQNVDLVYSLTTPGTLILKERIPHRPIVFSIVTYPVEVGLIENLKASGNNLVGTRNWVPMLNQLSLIMEITPHVSSIAFVRRVGEPNSTIQLDEMRTVAGRFGVEIVDVAGSDVADVHTQLSEVRERIDAVYSSCDTLVQGEAEPQIIAFAHEEGLPSFSCNLSGPLNGDLAGVVADSYQTGRLAGEKAALILSGATPSSLETSSIARPFIYVNQTTADTLGIILPQSVLAQAKQVVR